MATLLNIVNNLKKRRDEENTGTLSSLRTMSPVVVKNTANTTNNGSSLLNARQNFQQMNNQFREQAEQRKQQEQQTKQQKLLNSSLSSGSLLQNDSKPLNVINNQPTATVKKGTFDNLAKNGKVGQTMANQINKGNDLVNNAVLKSNPWKKYYGEEKQKIRDESFKRDWGGSTLQDMFNSGWDNRLAEVNARNRYANEQINKAYDDNGNVKNQALVDSLKKMTAENTNVARQYGEQEHANSRALGASYDSDYKDNQFLATLNAVRRMDVGNAMTGSAEGGGADAAKFALNLLPGMFSSPISGVANTAEAISGNGLDESTGKKRELTGLERMGRGVSGGIDLVGAFYGGSGDLLNSMGKALFKRGAIEAVKEVTKNTTKDVIKGYLKSMIEEGAEEGMQQAFEFFGNGGKLTTSDGEFDSKAFQQMLAESGQAAALGAAGGGLFHAGGRAIDAAKAGIGNLANRSAKANTNNDTNIVPSRIATTTNGTMVKQNSDGTTSRLTDSELANAIEKIPLNESIQRIQNVRSGNSTTETIGQLPINYMDNGSTLNSNINYLDTIANGKLAESAKTDSGHNISPQELSYATNNYSNSKILGFNENGTDKLNIVRPIGNDESLLIGLNRDDNGNTIVTNFKRNADNNYFQNLQKNKNADVLYDTTSSAFPTATDKSASLGVMDHGDSNSIPQNSQGVNQDTPVSIEFGEYNPTESLDEIKAYHKKYGNEFYEKMPNRLQEDYDAITDMQPRDTEERWTDPVTDETRIDESPRSSLSPEKAQEIMASWKENQQRPEVSTGTEPLSYAEDGTPEFVKKYTRQTTIEGVDNSRNARKTRLKQFTESLKNSDNVIVKKFYELLSGGRNKTVLTTLTPEEVAYYKSFNGMGDVDIDQNASITLEAKEVRHEDNSGHLTGIKLKPELKTGIWIDANPLTKSDIAMMDKVLKNPDKVYKAKDYSESNKKIIIEKRLNDNMRIVAEAVNDGGELKTKSYYKINKTPLLGSSADSRITPQSGTNAQVKPLGTRLEANSSDISILPQDTKTNKTPIAGDLPASQALGVPNNSSAENSARTTTLTQSIAQNTENNNQTTEMSRSYESESESLPEEFDIDHYITDQVKAQQKRSKAPLKERIADATAELKHYLIDDAVAYERYITDKNERLNLREGVDRVRSSDMIARQYMQDHGLGEIGKMSDADLNEFQQYLIAKRAQEVEAQGKATGRNKAADQALIDHVGDKYAREEAIIRQYTHDMLEYSAENGLISEKLKDKLIEENPNYVPMNRVFDVVEKKTGFKSKQLGNLNKQSVVQKMTGSERVIDNPIESLMSNTMRMINEAERNKVAKLIHESESFHEKTLKDGEKPHAGYDKLSYMVDGETVSYEVPELVAKEMKNLNNVLPKAADNILKVVGAPTRWLRSGATQNNPIFAASNLLRDQMQTLVTGKTSANIRGTKDALKATFGWSKDARALREDLNRAGIIGSEYRQTYGYKSGDLVKQLQADNNIKKGAIERIKHPIDAIGDLIGRTEYFTRAQQYFGTDGDAITKAQAARNNTLNFGRAGATTRILNRIIPFLNAGVQGGRITVNSFKNRPVHTTLAMATLTGVALAAKGAAEAQDKELWDRLDDSDKGQNIIIFTPDAHYNSESNRVEGIIKIPVAQMLYPLMDAANNLKGDASDAITLSGDILTAVTGLSSPNQEQGLLPVVNQLTPTAVKPFLEAAMNKSSYTGNDLVSEYDSNKEPEDKGSKYTTGLARTIASATGIDAPVVDNFIQNWGGGLAKDLSKVMTDNPDNKSDGGGVGAMFNNGFNRRFLSGTVESQYEIAEGLANNYKDTVKNTGAFKNLSSEQQQKVLNAIDTDMNNIASLSAKVEQRKASEDDSLTKRQTEIVSSGFNANNYIKAVLDKKTVYTGNGTKDAGRTLTGNILDYSKSDDGRKNPIEISDNLDVSDRIAKSTLEKYNSMTEKEWKEYINGSSAESAKAEYELAYAKYMNDLANDKVSDVQKIKREKELWKMSHMTEYEKKYRDAYSLAGNKEDMQDYLNGLDDEARAQTVAILNGLNKKLYDEGVIKKSTYKTRFNAINNTAGSKGRKKSSSGISSAEASALSDLAKTMVKNTNSTKTNTPEKPITNRKMNNAKLSNTSLTNYTPVSAKVTVTKNAKRNII